MKININKRGLSKHQRGALFISFNGKCAICNGALDEANFHADHIIPFRVSGRSNPHEMQALCDRCNWAKSGKLL